MDPNQTITINCYCQTWPFECTEISKMFPERFVRVTEGGKKCKRYCTQGNVNKKIGDTYKMQHNITACDKNDVWGLYLKFLEMFAINIQILCFEWLSYEPLIGSNKLFCQVLFLFSCDPTGQLWQGSPDYYSSPAVTDFAYVFD